MRAVFGAATWLWLVLMPWLAVAVMVSLLVPPLLALLAAAVFLVGRRLVAKDGDGAAAIAETLGLALVCPAVAFLVSLNRLPLST